MERCVTPARDSDLLTCRIFSQWPENYAPQSPLLFCFPRTYVIITGDMTTVFMIAHRTTRVLTLRVCLCAPSCLVLSCLFSQASNQKQCLGIRLMYGENTKMYLNVIPQRKD